MARRFVDLHTHSSASDGQLAPAEVIAHAERAGLAAIALTDHDTTVGLAEAAQAAASFPELRFVPGIEVSANHGPRAVHMLGLGIDPGNEPLQQTLAEMRHARRERNPEMIRRLQNAGVQITLEDVEQIAARQSPQTPAELRIVSRLHMAEAMRAKGYVRDRQEAFERYLGEHCPTYVPKERLTSAEAVAEIGRAGGLAVLAHPFSLKCENRLQLETILRSMQSAGLVGVEVYHSDHSPEQTRMYLDLARKLGLMVSGGSDFHGAHKPAVRMGRPRVPLAAVTASDRGRDLLGQTGRLG